MKKSINPLIHLGAVSILLLGIQGLFLSYQEMAAESISSGLEKYIDYAAREQNPMVLVRAAHELETLGLMTCVLVEEVFPKNSVIMDLSQSARCHRKEGWKLDGVFRSSLVLLDPQHTYRLSYRINNPNSFYFAIWIIRITSLLLYLLVFISIRNRLRAREIRKNLENKRLESMNHLATQVAHDIRSPLAALENILNRLNNLPEPERILTRTAVNRIKDIANNLIERNREVTANKPESREKHKVQTNEASTTFLLVSLVEPLLTEKRMQFRSKIDIDIDLQQDESSYGLFSRVQPSEFKRVLSNLINNSVEALDCKGRVKVDRYIWTV